MVTYSSLILLLIFQILPIHCARKRESLEIASPNIYKFISNNAYICSPVQLPDGSLVTFLNEDEGMNCTECNDVSSSLINFACGIRIFGNQVDPVTCFELPPLCIEEYTLRYSEDLKPPISESQISEQEDFDTESEEYSDNQETSSHEINDISSNVETLISVKNFGKSSFLNDDSVSTTHEPTIVNFTSTSTNLVFGNNAETEETVGSDAATMSFLVTTTSSLQNKSTISTTQTPTVIPFSEELIINSGVISEGKIIETRTIHPSFVLPTDAPTTEIELRNEKLTDRGQPEVIDENQIIFDKPIQIEKRRKLFIGTTTIPTTTTRITTPFICRDRHELCCFWATTGECNRNPFWMRLNCAKTCGTCNCKLNDADNCISTGIECTISTTTKSTTTTTTTTEPPTTTTTIPTTTTTRKRFTRPFTPPKSGFRRTQSTVEPSSYYDTTMEVTTKPTTTTTQTTTVRLTTTEDPCRDYHQECPFWASMGECIKNPFYMRPNCQKSCKSCGEAVETVYAPTPRPGCDNGHKYCNFWAHIGECTKNSNYMIPHCRLACRVC